MTPFFIKSTVEMNIFRHNGHSIKKWLQKHLELVFWLTAICLLFFLNTSESQASLCIFRFIGFNNCPGCGLGHSIYFALHLNFMKSLQEHLLGIPAVLIILFRIKQLSFQKKQQLYEV